MSWHQNILSTLEAMENLTNPATPEEFQRLGELGDRLRDFTAQLPTLGEAEREQVRPHLPQLGERIQTVINRLEETRKQTAGTLTELRDRAKAHAAYQQQAGRRG